MHIGYPSASWKLFFSILSKNNIWPITTTSLLKLKIFVVACPCHVSRNISVSALFRVNSLRPSDAYICVGKLTIIGSDNGLSPERRQAIIWTNAGILLIGPLGTNFSEILIEIQTFSLKKMRLKVSSAKRRPFCLGLNVLRPISTQRTQYLWRKQNMFSHFEILELKMTHLTLEMHANFWSVSSLGHHEAVQ